MAKNNEKKPKKQTNPNSLANLKLFEKGNKMGGRTKGSLNVSTILAQTLEQIAPDSIVDSKFVKEFCKGHREVTNAHAVACRILFEAIVKGESWALKEISDRTEGKAKQAVDVTSGGEKMQNIVVLPKTNDDE